MIRDRTVLVLGAGASADFELPLGWGLTSEVIRLMRGKHRQSEPLHVSGFPQHACEAFSDALHYSHDRSVDAFLEARSDLVPIGKLAIASVLVPRENPIEVTARKAQPSWLHELLAHMQARTPHEWAENRLAIVTFNYDRIVEFFMHTALMQRFKLSAGQAGDLLMRTVPIVHVHGQLGYLPFIIPEDAASPDEVRPFDGALSGPTVRAAAAGIRIIHEGSQHDPKFTRARELLNDAVSVGFMGFGYHPTNMERLNLSTLLVQKRVWGSTIGMTEQEQHFARLAVGGHIQFDTDSRTLAEFLRSRPILRNRGSAE